MLETKSFKLAAAMGFALSFSGCTSDEREISLSKDIMPILTQNCLHCHTAGAEGHTASGFSVETYADLMKGTRIGPVIQPGQSYASTLQVLVAHKASANINMPKGAVKLANDQIELIGKWIDQGAKNN